MQFSAGTETVEISLTLHADANEAIYMDLEASANTLRSLAAIENPGLTNSDTIYVPYYTGSVSYLPGAELFVNVYFDWQTSNATRLEPSAAIYERRTDGSTAKVHERIVLKAATDFTQALPDITNPKSPFLGQMAGRMVLDIWDQGFASIAQGMSRLGQAGITNCIAIIHNWQRMGYDNGLPSHYPANPDLGGDTALKTAIHATNKIGCMVALHENYVDYYPNYNHFASSSIALDGNGKRQNAWLNSGTKIQSLAAKPSQYVKNAADQSPEIHRRYETSASYIDVNSAVTPWWRVDMDSSQPKAGMFSAFIEATRNLWKFERESHNGPTLGEGNAHWFWSGLLDGVEAQLGAGTPKSSPEKQPLLVDFDLLKIHPLVVNHGMGYYSRWLEKGQTIADTYLLDTYRMQEVIFGHAPFVGSELWKSVSAVFLEQNLVGPVASRYGTQTVKSIQYQVQGVWRDTKSALAAHDCTRPKVQYQNGDVIVANNQRQILTWNGVDVPPQGWCAKGTGLLAFTGIKEGVIVDYSETPDSIFANARNQTDLERSNTVAEPRITSFRRMGSRTAAISMQWLATTNNRSENLETFLHIVPSAKGDQAIAAQVDYWIATPTSRWRSGQQIADNNILLRLPADLRDGTYLILVGLYSPRTGQRERLSGNDQGSMRYLVGKITLGGRGAEMSFEEAGGPHLPPDSRLNNNGKEINFGSIKTDGMVALRRSGKTWECWLLPISRDVTLHLSEARFGKPAAVTCDPESPREQQPLTVDGFWQLHAMGANTCRWTESTVH